jgi:uncharacterized protein YggU (UPF0235/DUF167 family)
MYLKLKVQAGAKEEWLEKRSADSYQVAVREPAENGRANREALRILAAHLDKPVGLLRIIRGAHQRSKIIEVLERQTQRQPSSRPQ